MEASQKVTATRSQPVQFGRIPDEHTWVLLAGWVHYLAFDYFVGGWILERAKADNLSHFAIVPVLALTFLLGPAGLLAFHLFRNITLRFQRKQA